MISSAVVIPEQPPSPTGSASSPGLKRRQSSFESEPSKRPRLDVHAPIGASLDYGPAQSPPSATQTSPPRRKSSLISGAEEKKRGQRLFGGLLSTLSQTKTTSKAGSSAALRHQKREDIEKRQLDRLKAQNEEREEDRRRRREELAETRQQEQKIWNQESRKMRWANMRAMAGFLRTDTEPRLYYKPWEVREAEKAKIDGQREDVEGQIEREEADLEGREPAMKNVPAVQETKDDNAGDSSDRTAVNGDAGRTEAPADAEMKDETGALADTPGEAKDPTPETKAVEDEPEHEHHGEELVQGQEDDVIY